MFHKKIPKISKSFIPWLKTMIIQTLIFVWDTLTRTHTFAHELRPFNLPLCRSIWKINWHGWLVSVGRLVCANKERMEFFYTNAFRRFAFLCVTSFRRTVVDFRTNVGQTYKFHFTSLQTVPKVWIKQTLRGFWIYKLIITTNVNFSKSQEMWWCAKMRKWWHIRPNIMNNSRHIGW